MITPLRLLATPRSTWKAIAQRNPPTLFILFGEFLPAAALGLAAQAIAFQLRPGPPGLPLPPLPPISALLRLEAGKLLIMACAVFAGAILIQLVADSFACRAAFRPSFKLIAYCLAPWALCRVADFVPLINPWAWVIVGVLGTIVLLYAGVPLALDPPPAQAFGLFIGSSFILIVVIALAEGAMMGWLNKVSIPASLALRLTT